MPDHPGALPLHVAEGGDDEQGQPQSNIAELAALEQADAEGGGKGAASTYRPVQAPPLPPPDLPRGRP